MAGPSAQIVGRVAVRVLPDTSGFRQRVLAELAGMRDIEFPVQIVADTSRLRQQLAEITNGLRTGTARIRPDVDVDTRRLARIRDAIRRATSLDGLGDDVDLSSLSRFEKAMLGTTLAAARMKGSLRGSAQELQEMGREAGRIYNKLNPMTGGLTESIDKQGNRVFTYSAQMRRLTRAWRDVSYSVGDAGDRVVNTVRSVRRFANVSGRLGGIYRALRADLSDWEGGWDYVNDEMDIARRTHNEFGKRIIDYTNNLSRAQRLWQDIDYTVRRSNTGVGRMFKGLRASSGWAGVLRQDMRDVSSRVGKFFTKPIKVPEFNADGKRIIDYTGNLSEAEALWRRIQFHARNAGREIASNVGSAQTYRNAFDRIRQSVSGIPGQIRRIDTEKLYRGFVRTGDAALSLKDRVQSGLQRIPTAFRSVGGAAAAGARGIASFGAQMRGSAGSAASAAAKRVKGLDLSMKGMARSALNAGKKFGVFGLAGKAFGLIGRGLGSMGSGLLNSVKGMTDLSRTTKLVLAVLVVLPPLIGIIGTLIMGLPSLLLAAGAGFAAIGLGMDGIKKAASVLTPEVDALKASLSATFEKGLTPIFNQLKPVFGVLQVGLNQVAEGVIVIVQALVDVVTSAQGMSLIQNILAKTAQLFRDLAPFFSTSLQGFLLIANEGANAFGMLSGVLNQFGQQWLDMVNRVITNGSFTSGMAGLAQVVSAVFTLWIDLLEYSLGAMGRLGGSTAGFFTGLGDIFFGLAPILEAIFALVSGVIQAIGSGLGPAFAALGAPLVSFGLLIGDLLAQMGAIIGPVFATIGSAIGEIFSASVAAIRPMIPIVLGFLTQLSGILTSVLGPVLPVIVDVMSQLLLMIGGLLAEALQVILPFFAMLAQYIGNLLVALLPLLPAIAELAGVLFQAFFDILIALMPIIQRLVESLLSKFLDVVRILAPALAEIIRVIAEIIPYIADFIVSLIAGIIPAMEQVHSVVDTVWVFIRTLIGGVLDIITGLIRVFSGLLIDDWSMVWEGVLQILRGAANALVGLIGSLVALTLGLLGSLLRGIGSLFAGAANLLYDIGRWIIEGFLRGLRAAWRLVTDFIGGIASWIYNNKGPISYDKRLLIPAGKAIIGGLHKGMESEYGKVQSLVSGIADGIVGAFSEPIDVSVRGDMDAISDSMPTGTYSAEVRTAVESDGFGGIADKVAEALAGWGVEIDGNGMAKIVNKSNTRKARR